MDPGILRGLERILVVAVGGVAVYLGYRLFLHIPSRTNSEGQVNLPGGISIFVTRVGPGIFFALYGAIVVAMSFAFPLDYSKATEESTSSAQPNATVHTVESVTRTTGFAPNPTAGDPKREETERRAARDVLGDKMALLNSLPPRLEPEPNPALRQLRDSLFLGIKLDVMRRAWDADAWGPFEDFERWIKDGEPPPPPGKLKQAIDAYLNGREKP